jgi:hypothetical protein
MKDNKNSTNNGTSIANVSYAIRNRRSQKKEISNNYFKSWNLKIHQAITLTNKD